MQMKFVTACVVLLATMSVQPAYAQSALNAIAAGDPGVMESVMSGSPSLAQTPLTQPRASTVTLSPSFRALAVSFGALQVMDVYSTLRGIDAGLTEANPMVRGAAGHPLALSATKAAATTSSLFLLRHVAKKNRAAAVVTLAAMNAAYAVVVAHNLRTPGNR